MKLLLDTHVLLWAAGEPGKLPPALRALLEDSSNTLLFSVASLWEIVIKHTLGREDFRVDASLMRRALLDNSYEELSVCGSHVVTLATLPTLHKDPFDRILVAQAQAEGLLLLTLDTQLARYPGPIRCF